MRLDSPQRLVRPLLQVLTAVVTAAALVIPAVAQAGGSYPAVTPIAAAHPAKRADFNGDGFADLAAGAPLSGPSQEGAVAVAYGGSKGIVSAGTKTWTLDSNGVPGAVAPNDGFGSGLASADFNRDGFADLAIGVPGREIGGVANAGEIVLLRGSPGGLTASGIRVLNEASAHVPGAPRTNDLFGSSLAPSDFNGDGWPDLAIGVAFKDVKGVDGAGVVDVLYGGPKGLGSRGARMFSRATKGIGGNPVQGADFGVGLAAGDLGNGPRPDLAIGVFADPRGGQEQVGSVTVLYSGPAGLRALGSQRWTPTSAGGPKNPNSNTGFGWSVAIADVGKSSTGDLAIGALGTNVQGKAQGGAVYVLYGGPHGLTATGSRRITEATPGIPTDPDDFDLFGSTLAAANFDGAGRADLAVGAEYKDNAPGSGDEDGGVFIIPGTANGVAPARTRYISAEDILGHDLITQVRAGQALTTGNFGRGQKADLAMGMPGLDTSGSVKGGGVAILFGRTGGLRAGHHQLVTRDTVGGFAPNETGVGGTLIGSPFVPD